MSLPRIIGITGYARHGKDTVASVFVKHGYQRVALADTMKQALLVLDPIVYCAPTAGPDYVRVAKLVEDSSWEYAKTVPEVRRLLQVFGTEVGRNMLGEDIWIEALAKKAHLYVSDPPRVVIPDVRFLNEARWIRRLRGEVYRVVRPDFDNGVGTTHVSEREIAQIRADETFINDQDLDYLRAAVTRYIGARAHVAEELYQ